MQASPEDIFHDARALRAREDRSRFLRAACGEDAGLRTRVEALLRADEEAGAFLAQEDSAAGLRVRSVLLPPSEHAGDVIGRYKLLHPIGEGGFGSVWMAEQQQPVVRRVAFKIIKLGMDTRSVIARFEAERQALAMMDHPNIARVLDAGATDSGRPYFVMELVKGEPITQYCDRHNLPIPERLRLFVQVCQAVQHAHTKGIIHRDLKPSNILVSTQDGPFAKVIDFGIAKATSARLTDRTLFTEHRQLIGTPAYMSPEQAEGSLDLDTRTDIYSLGVLLYELLTGMTPFDARELREAGLAEIQRIIREREPFSPSVRLSRATDTLPALAARRHTEPRALRRLVRGELDWIVMKALDKNRSRRYETAADLAADVARYLGHDPVLAGPASRTYRLAKLVRRNRPVFVAGVLVFLALASGLGVASYGLVRARSESRQKDTALATAQRSERQTRIVQGFLRGILRAAAPDSELGRKLTVRQFVDRATAQVGDLKDPETQASVRHELGVLYKALNQWPEASEQLSKALDLRKTLSSDTQRAETMVELAKVRFAEEAPGRGKSELNEARPVFVRADGEESIETLLVDEQLARVLESSGEHAEALALAERCLERLARVDPEGERSDLHASLLDLRSGVLWRQGRLEEAATDLERAVALVRSAPERSSAQLADLLASRATVLADLGRAKEASDHASEALRLRREVFPEEHSALAHSYYTLGYVCRAAGDRDETVRWLRLASDLYRKTLGTTHDHVAETMLALGIALAERGRERKEQGREDLREASELCAGVVAIYEGKPESNPACLADARSRRGQILVWLGDMEEGHRLLVRAFEVLSQRPDSAPETRRTLRGLVEATRDSAPEESARWAARLRELEGAAPDGR